MPLIPHRIASIELAPGQLQIRVHFLYDTPVAVRRNDGFFVHENPFPPDDPRHALTAEVLDILDESTPDRRKRRLPWHPDLIARYQAQHAEQARRTAETNAWLRPALEEAMESPSERRNRLRREARAAAKA
jgi:hypothetical protein